MARHVCLRIDENTQALRMRDHTSNVPSAIVAVRMTVLYTRIRQTTICRPVYREALCIAYMPVEDIKVVLMKHGQKIENGLHRKEFAARVEHEASVRIEIGLHLGGFEVRRDATAGTTSEPGYRQFACVQGGCDPDDYISVAELLVVGT
jgi:hypothetical protein